MDRCVALFLATLFLCVGCGRSPDTSSSVTVTDHLGRTVHFDRPVNRVVSLAPNLTELVFAAGAGHKLVAVTTSDDYPPAVDTIDRVSSLPVDFEAIAAKKPDLVLATDQVNPPGDTDTFETLNVPVYFFSFSSLSDIFESLRTMGTLLGTEARAADSARALEAQIESLRVRTDSVNEPNRPRVLVLIGDDTLYSFGKGSYIHTVVDLAGGKSITASIDSEAPTLSEEYVLREKPDVIVGAWGPSYDHSKLLRLHPTWDVVPAVASGRVYSLPPSLLLRPGPRLVKGARLLAAHLHPNRFVPPPSPHPDNRRTSVAPNSTKTNE